jgi:hypothetical protein
MIIGVIVLMFSSGFMGYNVKMTKEWSECKNGNQSACDYLKITQDQAKAAFHK